MAEREKPKAPALPFAVPAGDGGEEGAGAGDWESELAAWDASLPIEDAPKPAAEPEIPFAPSDLTLELEEEENPFADDPITVRSDQAPLAAADDFTGAAAEFAEVASPHSEAYASLVSSPATTESLFQREPASEARAAIFVEALPEMAAEAWRSPERLITVPARGAPSAPTDEGWRELSALLLAEVAVADTAAHQAELTFSAARVAEILGDEKRALELYDDALVLQPASAAALRARFRLQEARHARDAGGDHTAAHETLIRLCDAVDGEEREFYRALDAEWTLAAGGRLDDASLALLGAGPARLLAEAELAIRQGSTAAAAAALGRAAAEAGGPVGTALGGAAARLYEVAGDSASAAAERRPDGHADRDQLSSVFGRLRDAGRAGPAAEDSLGALLAILPASDLKVSVGRWAAALARQAGAPERAAALVNDDGLGPESPALLRDRVDLGLEPPIAGARELLARAAEVWPAPETRACLDLMLFELASAQGDDQGDDRRALDVLERGLAAVPGAVPLALAAEQLALRSGDPQLRAAALRLWAGRDPARTAYAYSRLAETLAAALPEDAAPGDEAVREALRGVVAAAPRAAAFWSLAAREARAGRWTEAAETLEAGAAAWGESPLAALLKERAAALRSAAGGATAPGPGEIPAELDAESDSDGEHQRARAMASLGRATGTTAAAITERLPALETMLALAADDPAALALVTLDSGRDPRRLAAVYAAAAGAADSNLWRLQAIHWLVRAGERAQALAAAIELHEAHPDWAPARVVARRLARTTSDPAERARILARLAVDSGEPAELLSTAEALEETGDLPAAEAMFGRLGDGPLAIEAQRGRERILGAHDGAAAPGSGDESEARVRRLLDAARDGRTQELTAMLEGQPPHEDRAGAATLYLAALLNEGGGDGDAGRAAETDRLIAAAMSFDGDGDGDQAQPAARRPGLLAAWRAADGLRASEPASRAYAAALATVARKLTEDAGAGPAAARAAATLLVRAAEIEAAAGEGAAAEARLKAAVERDPACLPALLALRRALVRRGALTDAAAICEEEAAAVTRRETAILTLLLAAGLARAVDRRGDAPPAARTARLTRAAGPLRKVLLLDPANVDAFEQLRAIFTETDQHAKLAEILAGRIAVASNPFEIAALRMARAELLAGPLGNHAAAKVELAAILQKEPQHGRALARLADLHYDDGAFQQAAELYLSRALVERSPEQLREIFLKLGRIYTKHLHDAKRAVDAYRRVLQLEAANREALTMLSELLVELGETKNAITVTERLVEQESDAVRRLPFLIRLGQLWEQAGDLRRAGARFRQATDDAPRNLQAVGEMVRHLDRTRDLHGRRALLDNSLLLLRGDLRAGKLDLATLRALVSIQQWRAKPAAAAAAAQLLAALSPEAADREAVTGWAAPPARGRRLGALARPEIDERLFSSGLPSGVRNIFRLLGEPLSKGPADLKRYQLARTDRVVHGQASRDIIDSIAGEVGVKELEVYVKPTPPSGAAAPPALLVVEPGDPPVLILDARILQLGPHAVRFAAARAARLISTHLDLVLRGSPADTGALVGGLVRQFVPDYRHPEVPAALITTRAESMAKLLSRRLKQDVMPFAVESASGFDLDTLHAAVRDGANSVGLLASANLAVCLKVVLATAGRSLTLPDLAASPEALALLDFGLSDAYDDLYREME